MSYRLVFVPSFETQVDRLYLWLDSSLKAWPEIHTVDDRYSA